MRRSIQPCGPGSGLSPLGRMRGVRSLRHIYRIVVKDKTITEMLGMARLVSQRDVAQTALKGGDDLILKQQ
jgi:hypothetical protein